MKDIFKLTAHDLLAIPLTSPESLFTGDKAAAKAEWHKLSKLWHPDRDPANDAVMAHVNALFEVANRKLDLGIWVTKGLARITAKNGQIFEIKYRRMHEFELGELYVGDRTLVFTIAEDGFDLVEDAKYRLQNLKFADAKMKLEFSKLLPVITHEVETADRKVIVIKKTPDQLFLRDVLDHFDGNLPACHVAWIISRMYNIGCFLKFNDLTHNDLSPDTLFISPEHHSAALLGGWWYSTLIGRTLKALPSRTMLYSPVDVVAKKVGDEVIDAELIRTLGRELLGDITGSSKFGSSGTPAPMLNWLRQPAEENIFVEYGKWKKVLVDSFGPPKFMELKLTADEVYA